MINKMNQDVEDQKIVKAQEGKHFRYEAQLTLASTQMRDKIRQKRLNGKLKKFWAHVYVDALGVDESIGAFPAEIDEEIVEKKKVLAADTDYISQVERSRTQFGEMLAKAIQDNSKEIEVQGYFEIASELEFLNGVIDRFSNNFEWIFVTAKNYYLDQVHNMLNYIVIMLDHWDDMDYDVQYYVDNTRRYELMVDVAERRNRGLDEEKHHARIRHNTLTHLRAGVTTTYIRVRQTEKIIAKEMEKYTLLTNQVSTLDENRILFQRATLRCGCFPETLAAFRKKRLRKKQRRREQEIRDSCGSTVSRRR